MIAGISATTNPFSGSMNPTGVGDCGTNKLAIAGVLALAVPPAFLPPIVSIA
jgi:hypothetical protein